MIVITAALLAAVSWGPARTIAHLADRTVDESSGIIASMRRPGMYWTMNDSGSARIHLFDTTGKDRGAWTVKGAEATDWEDLSIGPGPKRGVPYLYIGDIGDNTRERKSIVVYRVEEPKSGNITAPAAPLRFRYPDGPHDAEAMFVHPISGDLYILTKARGMDTRTRVMVKRAPLAAGTLQQVAELELPGDTPISLLIGRVTGAAVSPDGKAVALCDYFALYELRLPDGFKGSFDAIWKQPAARLDGGERKQGEAVCYRADGRALLLTSEGRPCPLIQIGRR